MAKQNVYDNEVFFEGYRRLRQKEGNANALFETPSLFSLLPDLKGKRILDLGCGCGDHCAEFIRLGAASVTAIDISAKMLEAAREQNADPKISYINMPMEDISSLEGGFALEKLVEPLPSPEMLEKHPEQADLLHRPDFLLIRASKNK